jgi:pimeloyl-ACP methyl ester carboxylesterase
MGVEGSYDIAGPPDAPAIVLVHGTRLSRAAWRPQLDGLSDEFRVIAVDLPGHGALVDLPFTLQAATDHVAAVIDHAAGGRAIVAGLSLGGYVAMDLAARSPDRVTGLVLAGATREPLGAWTLPYRGLALVFRRGHRGMLRRFDNWFFRFRFPAAVADPLIAGGFYPSGGAAALDALMGERFRPRLAAYPGPTLVLNGSLDLVFRLGERSFLTAARDGRRVVVPRATHLVNLDRPNTFNAAVRAFARRVHEQVSAPPPDS